MMDPDLRVVVTIAAIQIPEVWQLHHAASAFELIIIIRSEGTQTSFGRPSWFNIAAYLSALATSAPELAYRPITTKAGLFFLPRAASKAGFWYFIGPLAFPLAS